MDIYVLDSQLSRVDMLENYESMIWTERYSTVGDFDLHIKSTPTTRLLLSEGARLAINRSQRVMKVESVEKNVNTDGVEMLNIKGRSLEALFEERAAVYSMATTAVDKYYIAGVPGDIARTLFHRVCVAGEVDSRDIIPMIAAPTFARDPREPTTSISWLIEPDMLYNAIKKLCDVHELGFKLVRPSDAPVLQFYIYAGQNRTSNQSTLNPIMFSQDLGNIQNTKSLSSDQLVRNVAYVTSSVMNKVIYAPGVDPNVSGFQRRIVVIDLGDKGDPPNAGPYPDRPAEPNYEVYTPAVEPDYGYAYEPPEPDYGAPPEGMEGYALWKENRDAMWAQWQADTVMYQLQWEAHRNGLRDAWLTQNQNEYNRITNENNARRYAWLTDYDYEVAAWEAENIRLRNVWLAEISLDMDQKAAEEFEKQKRINSFDGELNERTTLRYGIDYDLGDLVELRNEDGIRFTRRVTEQIFVGDTEGEKAYPTLSETVRTT